MTLDYPVQDKTTTCGISAEHLKYGGVKSCGIHYMCPE